ncbi:MAG: MarR family transcriptional regulator [Myxococcota bacterium]
MKKRTIPVLDTIPEYASWVEVAKTYDKCQRLLSERLAPFGLSIARYEVLLAVARDEGLSQRGLGERLLSAKSNVTALCQRLEQAGLIHREVDPDDARGHCVFLTRRGKGLVRQAAAAQASVVRLMMEGFRAEEARTMGRVMKRVGQNLDVALAEGTS